MRAEAVVFSETGTDFAALSGHTDIFIPELDVWIGPFPLLDRPRFRSLLRARARQYREM